MSRRRPRQPRATVPDCTSRPTATSRSSTRAPEPSSGSASASDAVPDRFTRTATWRVTLPTRRTVMHTRPSGCVHAVRERVSKTRWTATNSTRSTSLRSPPPCSKSASRGAGDSRLASASRVQTAQRTSGRSRTVALPVRSRPNSLQAGISSTASGCRRSSTDSAATWTRRRGSRCVPDSTRSSGSRSTTGSTSPTGRSRRPLQPERCAAGRDG
jgi:hypothetical protein